MARLLPVTRPSVLALAGLLLAGAVRGSSETATFDLILRHGTVLDGTGRPRFLADVGVRDGHIAGVGDLGKAAAAIEIDATGLFVTPGFINLHSHATPEGLKRALNMLTQGVTTEILNADGGGPVDIEAQLKGLAATPLAVNAGANIGFNSVWAQVVGLSDVRPSPDAVERMRGLIARGLEQGAWGVSAGLDYKPGYFATAAEVESVVSVAKPWRTIFTNHDRLTPESGFSSRVGIAETISIAEHAGLTPVVTHMKAQGMEQKTAPALLAMMDAATARGAYTAADVYPYLAGQTGLAALLIPGWALDGGRPAMLARFQDPALRARIVTEAEQAMNARFGGPQGVYATGHATELVDAMKSFGVASPGEALVRLLEKADGGAILRFGVESDLVAILRHPTASIACDCGAVDGANAHPRYYGTFPRVLGRYVREQKIMTFEEAVRKMTGLPAATIGLADRGLLAPGMVADIAVFDPTTILDHATFEAPSLPSEGVRHVLVNGRLALRDGVATGADAGVPMFRSRFEPSRAMTLDDAPALRVKSGGSGGAVSIELSQRSDDRAARGKMRIEDGATNTVIELVTPGVLQSAPGWMSVTGIGRVNGRLRALTVVVDASGPPAAAQELSLTVRSDDGYALVRKLSSAEVQFGPRGVVPPGKR